MDMFRHRVVHRLIRLSSRQCFRLFIFFRVPSSVDRRLLGTALLLEEENLSAD